MPSQISHILVGREALTALPPDWPRRLDQAAFHLGCQGPDVFYHNRRTKPGAFLYGTRLHRRGWGSFLARFRHEAWSRGWQPEHPGYAFLVGQVTHGFLDRAAHPFVVSFSGWKVPGLPETEALRHSHAFFERILDGELWKLRTGTPITECLWQDHVPGPGDFPADFWDAWGEALHSVFPQLSQRRDVEVRLRNAISDTRGFLQFTSPSAHDNARRAALHGAIHYFHPINLPPWDFLNLSHRPWPDPLTGEERTESFLELVDLATIQVRQALATLTDLSDNWELRLGNGSLNLPGGEGLPEAPSFSRPWDYEVLYDREVRARLSEESPHGSPLDGHRGV